MKCEGNEEKKDKCEGNVKRMKCEGSEGNDRNAGKIPAKIIQLNSRYLLDHNISSIQHIYCTTLCCLEPTAEGCWLLNQQHKVVLFV